MTDLDAARARESTVGDAAAVSGAHILVVDDDEVIRALVRTALERDGYHVATADDGDAALAALAASLPAIVVSDVNMPGVDGLALLSKIRADDRTRSLPVLLLTTRREVEQVVEGLALGADDYLTKPFAPAELLARVRAKLDRRPVPVDLLPNDPTTGLLGAARFEEEVSRELARAGRSGRPGAVAVLELAELQSIAVRWGRGAAEDALRTLAASARVALRPLDVVGRMNHDRVAVLLPESSSAEASSRLAAVAGAIAGAPVEVLGESLRVTPAVGFAMFADGGHSATLVERAAVALEFATAHLDLQPVRWEPPMDPVVRDHRRAVAARRDGPRRGRGVGALRTLIQVATTFVFGSLAPFMAYAALERRGIDITWAVYLVVVVSLTLTSALIWAEGVLALRREEPPPRPAEPYPPATAVIAAYLPNEAATVVETVERFLRLDYPGFLQVILAYNTPRPIPVERSLRQLAARDPRFVPIRVEGSNSKAQNVNAVLTEATGRFVGVFDADHHPDPGSFARAWRWLSQGYDVVQGHCVVRNGLSTRLARMVAVEFETIYAVAHPGRARLHGFGIFGGSNGYWRTDMLHRIRMQGGMLTEDIDSSLRVLEAGGRIRSDPLLVSRELATTTLRQVWHQRLRWAQGWFQVSLRHLWWGLRSRKLTRRQKLGLLHLLAWREAYPWLSMQMFPLVAYWIWRGDRLNWAVPVFVVTSLFTVTAGPVQTYFAYRLADPEIRRHRRWFVGYLLFASVFYTEYKNLIARVAQVKQFMGEKDWRVTPRSPERDPAAQGGSS